jgi:hypothetical protein
MSRVVCWWSAGAASAVAAWVTLKSNPDALVVYCDTSSTEHTDNARFLADCERWYGKPIQKIRSDKYVDTWDVYERTGWLIGVAGARCTTELKKLVRRRFQQPDDVQIFGFAAGENERAERFVANNPEANARFPLIERGLTHADCLALLREAHIEIPAMYRLGYRNNNCIGCVKGGAGYWNKIRADFPATFDRMAKLERKLDVAILKRTDKGKRLRVFLDELDPASGNYAAEPDQECNPACTAALGDAPQPAREDGQAGNDPLWHKTVAAAIAAAEDGDK